jgi:hypothetical protein
MPSTDKARTKIKVIGGSDSLTGGCVCLSVNERMAVSLLLIVLMCKEFKLPNFAHT